MAQAAVLEEKAKKVMNYALENGAVVSLKAIELLEQAENFEEILDELIKEQSFVIEEEQVMEKILKSKTKLGAVEEELEIKPASLKAAAKESSANYKILHDLDVTGKSFSEGKVQDFLRLFQDKFVFLESLLKKRPGLEAIPISRLERMQDRKDVHLIGMVSDKRLSKNGHILLKIEDLEANCTALVVKTDQKNMDSVSKVLMDDVIAVKATKSAKDFVIVREIIQPDLPQRQFKKAEEDVSALLLSDFHVGSKLFMEKELNRFLEWLNLRLGSESEKQRIGKIKYLFIAGDNVDGIGVYPEQFDELSVKDIFEQYRVFEKIMLQVPEYIQVFVCPGQHDAVRRADPQPAITKEFVPELHELENIHFVGSPSWIEIEGLKCLMYHGASVHALYEKISGLSPAKPQDAIVELLKKRSLMTTYGVKQPYAPEKKDYLLIREEPDLYFGGEMHHCGSASYRGTLVLNGSTWQGQTAYQLKIGHVPTPAVAMEINLMTGKVLENKFRGVQA